MSKSKYDIVTSLVPTQKVGLYQEIYVKIMPHSFLLICHKILAIWYIMSQLFFHLNIFCLIFFFLH